MRKFIFLFLISISALNVDATVDSAVVSSSGNTLCYDSCLGSAVVQVYASLSPGPFRIIWRGNNLPGQQVIDTVISSDTIFNLCAGTYSVELIDLSDLSTVAPIQFSIVQAPVMWVNYTITNPTCYDSLNGSVVAIVSGGNAPYRYQWSTDINDTLDFIDTLPRGIYYLSVIDSNGCSYNDSVWVASPDSLVANISGTDITCNGNCDGIVSASPAGGSPFYHFLWSSSDTNSSVGNLCAGQYSVIVTDDHGCQAFDTVELFEADTLKSSFTVKNAICHGNCDGSIAAVPSGGRLPYSYHWSGSNDQDSVLDNACAGLVTATISDASGCFYTENIDVGQPQSIQLNESITPSTCNSCDGIIDLFTSGGLSPYKYLWVGQKPEDTTSSIDSLCAGAYEVLVTDSMLCGDTLTLLLSDDTSGIKDIGFSMVDATCPDVCDGAINAYPVKGASPFTYLWSPGGFTDSSIIGLCRGKYTVEITDANGCKRLESVNLKSLSVPSLSFNINQLSCKGACDGMASAMVSNAIPPYTFSWAGYSTFAPSVAGLCEGPQPVSMTDAKGCTVKDTVILPSSDSIVVVVTTYGSRCYNSCDGAASAVVSGGKGPYTLNWSNGGFADSLSGLCPGNYWLEVRDASGCTSVKNFAITSPSKIIPNPVIYPASCGSVYNGSIKLKPSGGIGPYSFQWPNGTFSDSIYGLNPGLVVMVIRDANNCSVTDSFAVSSVTPPPMTINVTHESCEAKCDGAIEILVPNTYSPVNYTWYTSYAVTGNPNVISGLCSGNYFVKVESKGCAAVNQIKVNPGNAIKVSFNTVQPGCGASCDGSVISSVSGGIPPYQYLWSNSGNQKAITNLCAGNYSLTVNDALGCSLTKSVALNNPQAILVDLSTSNLLCYNVCDGRIQSTVSGGTGNYNYLWSTGDVVPNIGNLCPGKYWLKVTDDKGCMGSDTISIGNGVPITASFSVTGANCGECDGSLTALPGGGNGLPYFFSWSTGDTTNAISNLIAGMYYVDIRDNSGCIQRFRAMVNNNGGPSLTDSSVGTGCNGTCDGRGIAIASGGNPPFAFQWFDPSIQTTDTANALCGGVYYYSVTDASNCISFDSVEVKEKAGIVITVNPINPSCNGSSNGTISTTVSGGIVPVKYLWSNGDTNSLSDSLTAGTYWVNVMDSASCSKSDTVTLVEPAKLALSFQITQTSCFNSCDGIVSAVVSGGTAPYGYLWNDVGMQTAAIAYGLCSGYITLTVTDSKGCSITDSALVNSPSPMNMNPVLVNPACKGGSGGSISLTPSGGGLAPFNYYWSNGRTGSSISGLKAGMYSVTVVDSRQCTFQNSYVLNDPSALSITINVTKPACLMGNGSATAIVSGGSGSYSFLWSTVPSKTTSTVNNLWPGIYTLTVTDNNKGCSEQRTVIVNNSGITAHPITIDSNTCPALCNSIATVHAGVGSFKFLWNDPLTQTDSSAHLCPGFYKVAVTDLSNGCVGYDTVTIPAGDFKLFVSSLNAATCPGVCNGNASVTHVGGMPPITYTNWVNTSPVQTGPTAMGLCGGLYIATAEDSTGCQATATVIINEPDSIRIEIVKIRDALCNGSCTGRAKAIVSGGNSPYDYFWNGVKGTDVATNLCPGMNTLNIIDFNGCSKMATIEISDAPSINSGAIVSNPDCGEYNGSIILNPSGGRGPYFYSWSTGASTSAVYDLFAGIYTVTISDKNGCSRTFGFFINNPNAPALQFDKNTVKCNGDCNGVARVTPLGGVSPFTYIWNFVPVSTLDSLVDLCSGIYFVKVTDATGCIAFGADTLTEPPVLNGNLSKVTDGCGGKCEGEVALLAQGGTAPYTYFWNSNPPQFSATADSLCQGVVQVVLTDKNDCVFTDSIAINPPPELLIDSIIFTNTSCFNITDGEATVFTSGGTNPVTYFWSDSQITQTASALPNGLLKITVTDQNNCLIEDSVEIAVKDTVLVEAFVDPFACDGNDILMWGKGKGVAVFQWFIDSSSFLLPIAIGDSVYFKLNDTLTIILRGQNNSQPVCFDFDTSYAYTIPLPVIDAGPSVIIEKGGFTQLLASPFLFKGSYAWFPSRGLNDTTAIDPIARPGKTTTYAVIGTNEFGCSDIDSVTVRVIQDDKVINGFSPNGDGVNDKWELPFLKDYPDVIVEVYSRWGIQVFRSEGYQDPWDGTFEGSLLPAASYYYVIDLYGNGNEVKTGPVTILY